MRTILVAMLVAAGIGWVGTSTLSAAPASGAVIGQSAASLLSEARYYRSRGRTCYVKCYRDFVIGPRVCRRYCGLF
jgi:hypothetical protein